MIKLTPVFDAEATNSKPPEVDLDVMVMKFEAMIWDNAGVANGTVTVSASKLVDDMGNVYRNFDSLVSGRIVMNGVRYVLTPSGHAVNFDAMLDVIEEAYRAVGRA